MRMQWLRRGTVLLALAVAGCGWFRSAPPVEVAVPEDDTTHLGTETNVSLAKWLDEPRAASSEHFQAEFERVQQQHKTLRADPQQATFLPELRPALDLPVFHDPRWSAKRGLTLPTYLADDAHDPDVALHLARHGDVDAALELAGPNGKEALQSWRGSRNYPVEWTQRVALALTEAQHKLARGEVDGATEIVLLHKQLRELLDPRTAAGPLGAALLPLGKHALVEAAAAWRTGERPKKILAEEVEAALKEWGEVPAPQPGLLPGVPREAVTRCFAAPLTGHTVAAATPANVTRALDLLALPVVGEGVEAVVAFLDKDQLAEVHLVYRGSIGEAFRTPRRLLAPLTDRGIEGQLSTRNGTLDRSACTADKLHYDASLLHRNSSFGAVVRVGEAGKPSLAASLPVEPDVFGAFRLDRSFEQNRMLLAPDQPSAGPARITKKDTLDRLPLPVKDPAPREVVLERDKDQDLTASATWKWSASHDLHLHGLTKLLLPLWAAYGPSRLEQGEANGQAFLAVAWEKGSVRYALQLPYSDTDPEFVVSDRSDEAGRKARLDAALALSLAERKVRWQEDKPLKRLPRWLHLEGITLGMSRDEVKAALPHRKNVRLAPVADGWNVLFLDPPAAKASHSARQVFLRFGPDNKLAEVRVRYVEGPAAPGQPALLELLKKQAGQPTAQPAPWAGLWTDLKPLKPAPVLYGWHDDCTLLTYQRDAGGSEVVLRDCPVDYPLGAPLPSLSFCDRGVDGCKLGDSRADVLKRWNVTGQPTTAQDGGVVLAMPVNSPYDLLVVYFDHDRVARVLARHRRAPGLTSANALQALYKVWGANLDHLGVVRRQDAPAGRMLHALGWHDDRTRVRMFGQETEGQPSLFTEWRDWPVSPPNTTVKK
jgi:hypothetical protein